MVSLKSEKDPTKPSTKNPSKSLRPRGPKIKSKKKNVKANTKNRNKNEGNTEINSNNNDNCKTVEVASASQQLSFLLDEFQSANGVQLSSLELESIKDTCILELSQCLDQDASNIGKHMKAAFGQLWKEVLCNGQLLEGKIESGSPVILIISASASRSLELLRGFRPLTKECPAAKLFSKHMKVEDQVSLLKNRVNIAGGTPTRIKKLIDIEALGLSRLAVVVLDTHVDVKGYSLFTLPQVREEFWDLYRNCFHERVTQGDLRISLSGPLPVVSRRKKMHNF
ncbi:protein CMS1 [Malania oleifera]|uniref:protein CMS1 n=1 Tax=Malania oleifera TaxID=397392 RepID=UPI0025ADA672|nr:protein CMS1 [Malania oleifera]